MEPTCWYCERALSPGESYWTIQAMRETSAGGRIDVESAEAWLTLCSGCADDCNLSAGPDIDWEGGRLTLLLAHEAAASPSECPHCQKPVVAGDAFCMSCGGAVQ